MTNKLDTLEKLLSIAKNIFDLSVIIWEWIKPLL